jgi:hypothetical protein
MSMPILKMEAMSCFLDSLQPAPFLLTYHLDLVACIVLVFLIPVTVHGVMQDLHWYNRITSWAQGTFSVLEWQCMCFVCCQ